MIDITLSICNSPINKIEKGYTEYKDLTGAFRDEVNLENPSVLVNGSISDICKYNYAHIPSFARYYFVRDMVCVNNSQTLVILEVDPLMSFKDALLLNSVLLERCESLIYSDKYIQDSVYQLIEERELENGAFTSPDTSTDGWVIVTATSD